MFGNVHDETLCAMLDTLHGGLARLFIRGSRHVTQEDRRYLSAHLLQVDSLPSGFACSCCRFSCPLPHTGLFGRHLLSLSQSLGVWNGTAPHSADQRAGLTLICACAQKSYAYTTADRGLEAVSVMTRSGAESFLDRLQSTNVPINGRQ